MSNRKIPYFVDKPAAAGKRRYYWQPSKDLRALGWRAERLPDDEGAAIVRAQELNAHLQAWRSGDLAETLHTAPAGGDAATPRQTPAKRSPIIRLGTMAHLIRDYKASRFFTERAPKTQQSYRWNMNVIEDWAGDIPITAIGPARVQTLYDSLRAGTPAKANAIVGMLRILLQHAVRREMVKDNAAEKPGMVGLPPAGRIWPADAVALFVETADRMGWHSIGTAVVINHWIGQREGDILALQRSAYRDGRFFIAQRKSNGEAKVAVPHSPWVEARIEAELKRQTDRGIVSITHLLRCETTAGPWRESYFQHKFALVRAKAAEKWPSFEMPDGSSVKMDDLWFMHLRHTAVTELAIAGCTVPEIAGITGHTLQSVEQILRRYLVRTSELADAAMAKRLAGSDKIAALFPAAAKESV